MHSVVRSLSLGMVTLVLWSSSGLLSLWGDRASAQIHIQPSPTQVQVDEAGQLYFQAVFAWFNFWQLEIANDPATLPQRQQNLDTAIDLFQQVRSIYQANGNQQEELKTIEFLSFIHLSSGQHSQAVDIQREGLTIARRSGNTQAEMSALNSLGNVYLLANQRQQALNTFYQGLALSREVGDRLYELGFLERLISIPNFVTESETALDLSLQLLDVSREAGDRKREGMALNRLGALYLNSGQVDQALTAYQQALTALEGLEEPDLNQATAADSFTLNPANQVSSVPIERTFALFGIGNVYWQLGQSQQAIPYYQQASEIAQTIDSYGNLSPRILANFSLALAAQSPPELAIALLKQSVNAAEIGRAVTQAFGEVTSGAFIFARASGPSLSQLYPSSYAEVYRRLADLLLQQGRVVEALQVLDLLKVEELQDFLETVQFNEFTAQGIELFDLEQQLVDQSSIDQIQNGTHSPEAIALMQQIRQTAPEQNLSLETYTYLQTRLQNLGANSALFYPLILSDRIELVIFTRNAPPIHRSVPVSRTELEAAIGQFRTDLQNPDSEAVETSAKQLYDWLFQPIAADLQRANIQTLIYAPDGQMRYVPLAALYDGQQWLIEQYQINYITALNLTDITPQPLSNPQILAGAFSEGDRSVTIDDQEFTFQSIPFALNEVETLSSLFPNTTQLLGTDFNRDALEPNRLNNYTIIHLATHGKLVSGNLDESFILLNNGEYITLREMRDWQLPNVALVVLSACQTAGDRLGTGIEIMGFGYQLQQAQARASIATLWEINDVGTNSLMDVFYSLLQQENMTQVEALRQAQIALISGDLDVIGTDSRAATGIRQRFEQENQGNQLLNHPYYWAPFILIGNGL